MWYDEKDEKQPNAQTGAPDAGGDTAPAFDPTRAFEDDADDVKGGEASADEIATLKAAIKEMDQKATLNYERYLRALAELENYKKRMARERMEQLRYGGEDLLREILPVVDNLERTLEHSREAAEVEKVLEGVTLIYRQFQQALEKSGIRPIDQAPCPFDPNIHQALERVKDTRHPDDTVVTVLQKGYILNDKVVRPAMVRVAKHS